MIRESFPAMSVYETLFRFADAIKKHMGVARCTSQYRGSSPHNTDDAGKALGPQWFRGDSGLYHWCRLPQELIATNSTRVYLRTTRGYRSAGFAIWSAATRTERFVQCSASALDRCPPIPMPRL